MKISVLGTRGFPNIQGGVEKHCEHLYPLLSDKFSITVFRRKAYLDKGKDNSFSGIRFIDLPSTRIKGFEALYHSFLSTLYCIAQRSDIVHIHNIGPGIFIPLLKLFGLKVVLTYHSPNYEHKKWGGLSRKFLKLSEKIATSGANKIIFVNKSLIKTFSATIQQKSVFIPNGVEMKDRSDKSDYIASLGLSANRYILTVGRITPEKGFDYLIEAFKNTNRPDYKLVIAGGIDHKSKYANEFLKQAQAPNIIMPGYTDGENLRQLYSHAALFILPSYNEGFPLVLLEAMNYRLPILSSDIPGSRQLGLPDDNFFIVGDAVHLSNKIDEVLTKGGTAVQYDLNSYSWGNIALQTEKVFLSIR